MAPTGVPGGLRALIVADGMVGERVWTMRAPDTATRPYISIADGVSIVPLIKGDGGTVWFNRTSQVDLWEHSRDEDPAVLRQLVTVLSGARVALDGMVGHLTVDNAVRFIEVETNTVHWSLTVTARHSIAAY